MPKAKLINNLRLLAVAFVVVCVALPLIPVGYADGQSTTIINNSSTVGASYYTVSLYTGAEDPGTGDMIYTPVTSGVFDAGEATYSNINSSYVFGIEPVKLSIDDLSWHTPADSRRPEHLQADAQRDNHHGELHQHVHVYD